MQITKYLKQKLVLWESRPFPDKFGRPLLLDPIELDCRWEDLAEEMQNAAGKTVVSQCYIMLSRTIPSGSIVMKGTLADWQALPTYPAVPTKNQGAFEIIRVQGTPSLRGEDFFFEAWT